MHEGLLTIGSFSRASSLSIKTLRAYHENGLLIPARVDPANGYRSYAVDQLADAMIILRLRELDVPIPKVNDILRARDPQLTRRILEEHRAVMETRLMETERIVDTLQNGLASTAHTPVHLTTTARQPIIMQTEVVAGAALWSWLARTHDLLADIIDTAGGEVNGPRGAFYPAAIEDDETETVTAFWPVTRALLVPASSPRIANGEFPAATWAVLVHTAGFDTIGETYRSLGAWVAVNEESADGDVCERYHAEQSIEILWPVGSTSAVGVRRSAN